jgi:hypothetical protein
MHTPYRSHIRPAFTLQIGVHETQCAILRVVAGERRISLHIASSSMNSAIARSRVAYADTVAAIQRLQPGALSLQRDVGAMHLSSMRDRAIARKG